MATKKRKTTKRKTAQKSSGGLGFVMAGAAAAAGAGAYYLYGPKAKHRKNLCINTRAFAKAYIF